MTGILIHPKSRIILFIFLVLNVQVSSAQLPNYPQMKFIVFSDPHYFDPSLGIEGKAFQEYLDNDRKLLKDSKELTNAVVSKIADTDAEFVLVAGDLTKDGEIINHQAFAEILKGLEKSGKKVFVIPGNHDVNNPHSFKYSGDNKERVSTVTPDEFASIYSDFGYGDALKRDKNSLSYVAELKDGGWLLALDACRYKENPKEGEPITSGIISDATMIWIKSMLKDASDAKKSVIVMMHHGVLEHYAKQKKFYGEYVVDNYKELGKILAAGGAQLVFTGHFHAQDITMGKFDDDKFLLDIETGSLMTFPCPYRSISISESQILTVKSEFVTSIPSRPEYAAYAREYNHTGIAKIAANTLIGMGVDSSEAWSLSGQVADAFLAHYAGDEITPEKPFNMEGIGFKGKFLIGFKKNLVKSLHKDLYPADNTLEIKLK